MKQHQINRGFTGNEHSRPSSPQSWLPILHSTWFACKSHQLLHIWLHQWSSELWRCYCNIGRHVCDTKEQNLCMSPHRDQITEGRWEPQWVSGFIETVGKRLSIEIRYYRSLQARVSAGCIHKWPPICYYMTTTPRKCSTHTGRSFQPSENPRPST